MIEETLNPTDIMKSVCKDFGISMADLVGRDRRNHLVKARKECAKRMIQAGMRMSDIAFYMKRRYNNVKYYLHGTDSEPTAETATEAGA